MHSAHDALTRWPALEVAAKRAGLQNSLHLSPGSIADALNGSAEVAGRAASGLWRRDPSVWSADPTVQKAIALPAPDPAVLRELCAMLLARLPRSG